MSVFEARLAIVRGSASERLNIDGNFVTTRLQTFRNFDSILFAWYLRARLTVRVRLGKGRKADS